MFLSGQQKVRDLMGYDAPQHCFQQAGARLHRDHPVIEDEGGTGAIGGRESHCERSSTCGRQGMRDDANDEFGGPASRCFSGCIVFRVAVKPVYLDLCLSEDSAGFGFRPVQNPGRQPVKTVYKHVDGGSRLLY